MQRDRAADSHTSDTSIRSRRRGRWESLIRTRKFRVGCATSRTRIVMGSVRRRVHRPILAYGASGTPNRRAPSLFVMEKGEQGRQFAVY